MAPISQFDPDEAHSYGDWDDPDLIWEDTKWKHPASDFQREILSVCGRKYFATKADRKKAESIENGMKPMKNGLVKYPKDYVEGWMKWAKEQNKFRTTIIFKVLASSIRNPDNLTKYYNKKHSEAGEQPLDRNEYSE